MSEKKWEAARAAIYGLGFAIVALLLYYKKIELDAAPVWLGLLAAILGLVIPILALFNVPIIRDAAAKVLHKGGSGGDGDAGDDGDG